MDSNHNQPRQVPPLFLVIAIFCAFSLLSSLAYNAPFVAAVLRVFPVAIHEMGHAVGCLLTGGDVTAMVILPHGNFGGLTWGAGGWSFVWTQTGYLGLSAFAAGMLWMTGYPKRAGAVLVVVGVIFGGICGYFMGAPSIYSVFNTNALVSRGVAIAIGLALIIAGLRLPKRAAYMLVVALAVWTAAAAEMDLISLFLGSIVRGESQSDAAFMHMQTGIPATVWIGIWLALTNLMFLGVYNRLRKVSSSAA